MKTLSGSVGLQGGQSLARLLALAPLCRGLLMSFLLSLLMSLLLSLPLSVAAEESPRTVRMALTSMPLVLDPRLATDATSARINRLLYVPPVGFDQRFAAQPGLCDFEQLDALTWRLSIVGEPASFSSGQPVRAEDIAATYESVLVEATASPHRGSLSGIERIEVLDDQRLNFHLREPDALFPGKLVIGVLPAALLRAGHNFGKQPVGSGAFEFVERADQARLRLRRRVDELGLEFVRVSDPTVRVLKLLRGEVDMLQNDLPPEVIRWLERRDEVDLVRGRGSNFAYVGFNFADPLTGDVRVRRAVALALDREAIIEFLLGNAARLSTSILAPEHWAGAPQLKPIAFDLVAARALVRELGYGPGNPLPLVYKTSSDPFRLRLATVIQAQLREAHIAVELRSYDWGTFYADIKSGNFQMFSLAWVGVKLPDIFRYTLHSASVPPTGANRGRYASATADALIEAAEAGETLAEQAGHYRALQELLLADLPYVPLWHEDHVFASRRDLRGYRIAPDGAWDALADVQVQPGS